MADYKFIKVAEPSVGEEEVEAVRKVLLSGNYVSGNKVKEFEKRFAEYIGVKHAVAVNSGTAALHIALEALGVGKGDEVIVPPLTFFATVSSVLYLGAKPVFADIDFDDLCLSPEDTEKHITPKTKAIVPVHLFGASAKIDAFQHLSNQYGIKILEDCAQAHGTEYIGKKVGSIGDAGAFSFFATKHMTTGEGGMITTHDDKIRELCRSIRNHGMVDRDTHSYLGYNNRMNEIAAAIGIVQMEKLENLNNKRIKNSNYLIKKIRKLRWIHIPFPSEKVKHTYFWCPVLVKPGLEKSINDLKNHLRNNRIGFRHRYKEPLYKQPILKRLGLNYSHINLPNAEKISGNVIGIPNHPGLNKVDLDRIIEVLFEF